MRTLCRESFWQPHQTAWLSAYAAYRHHAGDPWRLTAAAFPAAVRDRQRKLYASRSSGGQLARIRRTSGLVCCAICGSHHNGTLDHYLPKQDYPEFSIMPSNVVPACSICNSGAKGRISKGQNSNERFLHPYFDKFAQAELWSVKIIPPYRAACFQPEPLPHLSNSLRDLLRFHLKSLLKDAFQDYVATQWGQLPFVLRVQTGSAPSAPIAQAELDRELRRSAITAGINGWRTALLRGVARDSLASAHIFSLV